MQKIQTAYELKTKCIESDKYLSSILGSTLPEISQQELPGIEIDETPFLPSLDTMAYYGELMDYTGNNDSTDGHSNENYMMDELIEQPPVQYKGEIYKSKKRMLPRNMKSGRTSTCNICQKVFTYIKSYKRHMEKHKQESQAEETYKIQISDHSNDLSCKNIKHTYNFNDENIFIQMMILLEILTKHAQDLHLLKLYLNLMQLLKFIK